MRKWIRNAAALELAAPQAASQTKAKTSGPEYPPLSYPVSPTTDSPPLRPVPPAGHMQIIPTGPGLPVSRPMAAAPPALAPNRMPIPGRPAAAPAAANPHSGLVNAAGHPMYAPMYAAAAPGLTWVPHGGGLIGAPQPPSHPYFVRAPGSHPYFIAPQAMAPQTMTAPSSPASTDRVLQPSEAVAAPAAAPMWTVQTNFPQAHGQSPHEAALDLLNLSTPTSQ